MKEKHPWGFRSNKSRQSNIFVHNIKLKERFTFIYASTGLGTKILTIASNRDFESYLSIRCLASRHIFRFFHFCRGFFLCNLLINVQSSSTVYEGSRYKILVSWNLDPSLLTPEGSVVHWFAVSGGKILFWRGASWLRTFMSSSVVFDFGRNTSNMTDFRQISPKHSTNDDKRKCVGKFWYLKYLSRGVH